LASIQDDRGYNQGFKPSKALDVRTERRCNYLISQMGPAAGKKILEIGCGTGETSYMLALRTGCDVLGVDICSPFIEQARKNYACPNLRYEVMDFNKPGFDGGHRYDYIVGNGILHHLYYNIERALTNIRSLLTDGGKLIFIEPNIFNPYCLLIFRIGFLRKMARLEPEEMAFGGRFIREKLEKTGYRDIDVRYMDFLVPCTPSILISPVIILGALVEKTPVLNMLSQSIFITATR